LTEASERGYAPAQSRLAGMYLSGQGVPTDYAKSFYWTKKAADQGRALDEYALGIMYWSGIGIGKNEDTGRQWIRKAADKGFPAAIEWRAKNDGYTKTAEEWFNEGANYHLAGDYAKAVPSLTKASDMGHALSASMIGGMYFEGTHFAQDDAKAFQWYKIAADRGNRESQFLVGLLYYVGRGVTQDQATGKQWIRKSAAQGLTQATEWLAKNGG
ncbi:MAG: tetratricopeptide repeat protein, partial [Asticcacaulis sp.]